MNTNEAVVKKSSKNGRYYGMFAFQDDVFTMSSSSEKGVDVWLADCVYNLTCYGRMYKEDIIFVTKGLDLRKLTCPLCDHFDPQCDVCSYVIRKED